MLLALGCRVPSLRSCWRPPQRPEESVGSSLTSTRPRYRGKQRQPRAVWENRRIRYLPTPRDAHGSVPHVVEVNARNEIIGVSSTELTGHVVAGYSFLWQNGKLASLPKEVFQSEVVDINNRGQIIGGIGSVDGFHSRNVLWQKGVVTVVAAEPSRGESLRLVAISETGRIAVRGFDESTGHDHALVWDNGRLPDLGTLPGAGCSPVAINDCGQIVGYCGWVDGRAHTVLWTLRSG
jgi:probable HAF family extracellular repeat protein